MTDKEFEKIFGNTPFENIQKIKKYINIHFVPYEEYIIKLNELNKKWEGKIKAKLEELNNKLKNADETETVFIIKQQQLLQSLSEEE